MPLLINSLITQRTPQKMGARTSSTLLNLLFPLFETLNFPLHISFSPWILYPHVGQYPYSFIFLLISFFLHHCALYFSLISYCIIFAPVPPPPFPFLSCYIFLWFLSSSFLFLPSSFPCPSMCPPKYLHHLLSFSMQKANMQRRLSPVVLVCRLTRPAFSLTYFMRRCSLSAMKLKECRFVSLFQKSVQKSC